MNFEGDVFISYAHLDNIELIEGHKGWVAELHRLLENRVGCFLGKQPQIWRDPKLQGNDIFADTLLQRIRGVAALVSVVSPRYVRSEWTQRELNEFLKAAEHHGGVRFRDKARIFKVLKTPVPLQLQSPALRSLLGYEFFKTEPETGKVRELDNVFGLERDFFLKVDDLAHDICFLLEMLETSEGSVPSGDKREREAVFLAETTSELKEQREAIRRELRQHGYTVLPEHILPLVPSELKAAIRDDLERCGMSIHLVGKNYSLVPEGCVDSLVEIQNELAIERGERGGFSRLLWIPPGVEVEDQRQRKVIEQLRMDPRIQKGADLLETSIEDLSTVYLERLRRTEVPADEPKGPAGTSENTIYFMYDQRDADETSAWSEFLFKQGFEIIRPVFEGDEAEVREYHEENLRSCDGVLILYGRANECWLRRKLREVQKSAGYGRTKPMPTIAIIMAPPKTAEKESFRTHGALVIPQMDGFTTDPLSPFIARLKG